MFKRMLTMMIALALLLGIMIPAASLAEFKMYVYTANGKTLNVRSAPTTGDNIIKVLPFGAEVYVDYHLGNGWTALMWTGESYDHVYVQTRFLVDTKPTKKPTPVGPGNPSSDTNSGSLAELNKIFKTWKVVEIPYQVTVRPTRASGWVNVRFAPSKQAELLSTHRDNEMLTVIGELNGWYQVETMYGAVGYVSSQFVRK